MVIIIALVVETCDDDNFVNSDLSPSTNWILKTCHLMLVDA